MATKTNTKKVGGILSLVFAGLLTGATFTTNFNPKVTQVLTTAAVVLAAVSKQLNIKGGPTLPN